jgi:16S rRNA (cytosine967-C5)-methyltransferase
VSRRTAYDLLRAVDERGAYANLELSQLLRERRLDARDAALATELAYGALRGRGSYDAVLAACVSRPLAEVDPPVLDVLRLGAHQLLATRVPTHAAVSATVELARAVLGEGPAKLVNAVLRKVTAADHAGWLARVAPDAAEDPVGHLAVVHSHPRWVVEAFRDALGEDPREGASRWPQTAALLAADNDRPRVTLVARPGRSTMAELVAAGAVPASFSPWAAMLPEGDPRDVAAVRDGRAGVQDEGSQLVTLALAAVPVTDSGDARPGSDRWWLDLCAGPGGKAALLAAVAARRGARLIANEIAVHRAALVARAAAGSPARVVVGDGTAPAWHPGSFDRVLADVPCTGLGALRRRPEARWRRAPEDLDGLVRLQRALLRAALDAARPGGVVAYVTCSPHLAETRGVVERVLADVRSAGRGVDVLDARPFLPGVAELGGGPYVQLWPHRHGTDAMFLALLRPRS